MTNDSKSVPEKSSPVKLMIMLFIAALDNPLEKQTEVFSEEKRKACSAFKVRAVF